jgi:hypothetical protein
MRIAACLSGHTRNYTQNHPNFYFDVDYFISSCLESGLPNSNTNFFISYHNQDYSKTDYINVLDVLEKYKPIKQEFIPDTYIPKELMRYQGFRTKKDAYLIHIGLMFYRMHRANYLKKIYEIENDFRYDFVIRSRFDVKVNQFDFNKNYLYLVCDKNKSIDLFFAGKSYLIDVITDCYLWFIEQDPNYLSSFLNGEDIFYHYVDKLDLGIPFVNNFHITFNKDYPIQNNIIRNGIVIQYNKNNEIINLSEWHQ